jgi:hypothetical protein
VNKLTKIALCAALPAVWAAGCSDFLKGGNLTTSPNNPVTGSANNSQLFVSIQANMFIYQEGDMGRAVAQWMQQLIGVARQQIQVYNYSGISNATYDGEFQRPYVGGGLIDIRVLEAGATAGGDLKYLGVAQVMEAWFIGYTADVWGDIPYSQAVDYVNFPTPILDTQQDVYNAVETLLSTAITNMAGAGAGPGTADLVYAGDMVKWTALAHTLKARFYMHQAEQLGNAAYSSALTEAGAGIGTAVGSADYLAYHNGGIQLSTNSWWQFMDGSGGTGRAGDLVAAAGAVHSTMWDMMATAADPRFPLYFNAANTNGGEMSLVRLGAGFPQPLVTAQENFLILAEANFKLGNAGPALTALNAAQALWATATPWHAAVVVPATPATLANISYEYYVTLFQNTEEWNVWKRTCLPVLAPVSIVAAFGGGKIPARMWYGQTEEQTNPNIPPVGTAPNGDTNWNDPVRCP